MRLVKILLPINQRGTSEACAAAAFGLAERFGASLEVLHACPAPADRLPYATELSPLYFEELTDVGTKQVALEKREAEAWLSKTARNFPKIRPELVAIEGPVAPTVAARARVADLCVLPSIGAEADPFWSSARDAALFHSGRPLLVMPEPWDGAIGETVLVAWKNSVEAVRAVGAARPFLQEAKRVKLVSIAERSKEPSAAAVTDYLTKSGLKVELVELMADGGDAGPILLETVTRRDVLLVMGAYGHWRWREFVFGGATDYVLRNTPVPALMMISVDGYWRNGEHIQHGNGGGELPWNLPLDELLRRLHAKPGGLTDRDAKRATGRIRSERCIDASSPSALAANR